MRLSWRDLGTPRADKAHGKAIEISGWPTTPLSLRRSDYFMLMAEPNCCAGCVPNNPLAAIEVFAVEDLDLVEVLRELRQEETAGVLELGRRVAHDAADARVAGGEPRAGEGFGEGERGRAIDGCEFGPGGDVGQGLVDAVFVR